ncbi:G protein-coupled receptor 34 like [Megalops cyprinoides]|uniref:G protein-coupled receptor 34 like n=1 Tax=Megalops cyprinoides TaxID=118141 RepID=UPI00186419B8|nr:G protein-coupled receptor 34 like [Megalops cyprinoides]
MQPGLNASCSGDNATCDIQDGFLSIVLPTGYSIIFIIGVLSNAVTIVIFFLRRWSNSSITVYMRHMTMADLLLVLCLPVRIYYHNRPGPFFLCKVVGIFFYINMYASIMFLSLISLDRYLKITKPVWVFKFQKVNWSRRTSYAVWVILALGAFPVFLGKSGTGPCQEICFHFHKKRPVAGSLNLITVLLFYVLCLLLLCFYGKIAMKLRSMSLGNGDEKAKSKMARIVVKTFVVPTVFTVCFMPYHLVRVPYVLAQMDIIQEQGTKQTLHLFNELMLCLSALNSCLDPIIYFLLSSTFRKTVICAIQGKFKKMYAMNQRRTSLIKSVTEM